MQPPLRLLELRNWIYFGKTFGMWSRMRMMIWRSVCTISALSVDEEGLCVGLGSNGDLELWDRRKLERVWKCHAHDDGVYGIDMNSVIVVSVGDDGLVNIYDRFMIDQPDEENEKFYGAWHDLDTQTVKVVFGRMI